jgi:hypothetical protein
VCPSAHGCRARRAIVTRIENLLLLAGHQEAVLDLPLSMLRPDFGDRRASIAAVAVAVGRAGMWRILPQAPAAT